MLRLVPACSACGLSLKEHDTGDGPAFFAITLVGFIVTGLAGWVEYAWQPPYWLHGVLWLPLTLILCILVLRYAKSLLVASAYQHRLLSPHHEE